MLLQEPLLAVVGAHTTRCKRRYDTLYLLLPHVASPAAPYGRKPKGMKCKENIPQVSAETYGMP